MNQNEVHHPQFEDPLDDAEHQYDNQSRIVNASPSKTGGQVKIQNLAP